MKKLTSLFTNPSRFTILATGILMFAFFTRVLFLNFPSTFYFDEVYHGFTATTYLHNDARGYEYWQTPPEGVAYEWTHPPLAKLLMAAGMLLLGENTLGWRISSVIFGTGVIAATGVLSYKLFANKKLTLIAMGLLSLDGLLLTMSRIAMNDMHFVFFMLLGCIFYIQWKKILFSTAKEKNSLVLYSVMLAGALGLALSSKWTTLYAGACLIVDTMVSLIFYGKFPIKKIILSATLGALVVSSVYLSSYGQFFLQGHTLTQWKETTQQMWWYHTGLVATHGYQSRPWQWILDLRPVWMHVDYSQADNGKLAHIYNVGNPIFFWVGLIAAILLTVLATKKLVVAGIAYLDEKKTNKRDLPQWPLLFTLLLYAGLWVPWVFSPRIMFFYHYSPALPFLSILTAYGWTELLKRSKRWTIVLYAFLTVVGIAFALLYPLNTGLLLPNTYFDTIFRYFPMWR